MSDTANRKCCQKCAFRSGSPERSDGYGWITRAEAWTEGTPFYCHESVPGHSQEVKDDRERLRICAGWSALRGKPIEVFARLIEEPANEVPQ